MQLSSKQKKYLRGLAHSLNPVVMIGNNGVSPGVVQEIDSTLDCHELIKIRIRCENQEDLAAILQELLVDVKASVIQTIGHSVILFRRSMEQKIALP